MADPHVVSGLKAKRAELAGRIEATQTALRQLVIDLDHIDASLRLFDPTIDLEEIRPKPMPPRHCAFRGEVMRIVLDAMREAQGPVTSHDLALRVMRERGLNEGDQANVRMMVKRVGAAMRLYKQRGLVVSRPGPGPYALWERA